MAGGTWTRQNKVRPGVYVNFNSEPQPIGAVGDRGIVTMPLPLSWGAPKTVISVETGEAPQTIFAKLGYPLTAEQLLLVREALKRARVLLLYRLNEGTRATATVGSGDDALTVTAKYGGVRGNDITIVIQENIDDGEKFDVKTYVAGSEEDAQTVGDVGELQANDWVSFSGTSLVTSAGIALTGGADGTATNEDYVDYLSTIEIHKYDTMALPSSDTSLKGVFSSFTQRMREDEGRKMQLVVENYPTADYEGVISVKNGVVLADGSTLTAAQATAWVAGATAGADVNEALTYTAYDDAVDVAPRYTHSEITTALQNGEFVFTHSDGRAVVEQDINSLHSFTPTKGKEFSKNRVIRVLDSINNDFVRLFSNFYIGKVSNNADGRNLLKNECINYLEMLQGIEAIQQFSSQEDITVQPGEDSDSVLIGIHVQPVDSVEKLYVTVTVQ